MTKKFKWTEEDINFLIENYATKGSAFCATSLGVSQGSVQMKANRIGLKSRKNQKKTHIEYEEELMQMESALIPIEPYITSHTPIMHECLEGHTSKVKPYSVLSGKGCKKCDIINRTKTHEEYLAELQIVHPQVVVLDRYVNASTSIRHRCTYGHIWWCRPSYMLTISETSHCPDCTSGGFKGNKPGILYYIKIVKENLEYYKIGITNRSVQERFKTEPKTTDIKIIFEKPFLNGYKAREEEQSILKQFAKYRQNIPELLVSGGNTELFEFDVLGFDK